MNYGEILDKAVSELMKNIMSSDLDLTVKVERMALVLDRLLFHAGTVEFMLVDPLDTLAHPKDEEYKKGELTAITNKARRFTASRLALGRIHGAMHAGLDMHMELHEMHYFSPYGAGNPANELSIDLNSLLNRTSELTEENPTTN